MKKPNKTKTLSDETMKSAVAFGEILRRIHNRLIAEGYEIKDGKVIKN